MMCSMPKKYIAIALATTCAAAIVQAQGGRGGRGQGEAFPSAEQFADSAQAQQHVAAAMRIAGTDVAAEAKALCTPTGPQRPALARAE